MVRAVFLVLLSANLLFLAWARWIDAPRDTGPQDSLSRLPRLQIVNESPSGPKPTSAHSTFERPILATSTLTDATLAMAERTSLRTAGPAQACTSVGPFNDIASAARAAGLLTQRGFSLQQRAEEGETIEGYWVFVGGMQSDEEVAVVVGRLEKSGFTDAHIMKNYSTNRRLSVGMFSTRERADKRAAAVRNMGLQPEIGERKFPGTVYWVDVALNRGPGGRALPEYAFADIGHARVGMQPCPAGLRRGEPVIPDSDSDGDGVFKALQRTTVASAPKAQ
jgi:hypothetical protein